MTDDELRALVREAIAKHLGTGAPAPPSAAAAPTPAWRAHVSFGKFLLPRGADRASSSRPFPVTTAASASPTATDAVSARSGLLGAERSRRIQSNRAMRRYCGGRRRDNEQHE
jgi:hypothetical protein